jgi:hypothetical protein
MWRKISDCKLRLAARIRIEDLYCKLGKKLRLQLTRKLKEKGLYEGTEQRLIDKGQHLRLRLIMLLKLKV